MVLLLRVHIFSFFLLLFAHIGFGQLDVEHWLPPLHSRSLTQIEDHYVYLSTPNVVPFTVTITNGAGTVLATPTISASSPFVYNVGFGESPATPLFVPIDSLNQAISNCGLILTAPQAFYANERMRAGSQAESLTAKGVAAKGTTFRVGGFPQVTEGTSNTDRNFTCGIIATQNNTTVTFSNYNVGVLFAGIPTVSSPTMTVTLQAGESYVLSGYTNTTANLAGFVGALVQSNNPIVLSNGNLLGNIHPTSNSRDMGVDQSVPVNRLGQDYILVEGNGIAEMESPIVIAHFNNTQIFVNGSGAPIATIQAGQYYIVPNTNFQGTPHRNMFVHTSQPAYVYQALAGSTSQATGGLNFIPPFNCFLPNEINSIPLVEQIGATIYTGGVMIFTQQGANLQVNGVTQSGAVAVSGTPWETYKLAGLTGNISITSDAAVAAGIFGVSSSAGFAGYFSGFSTNPEASDFSYLDTCVTSIAQFVGSYDVNVPIDSVSWNFGDPSTGSNNVSTSLTSSHDFSSAGTYVVQFIAYRCENDTVTKTVTIIDLPTPSDAGDDLTTCVNYYQFNANAPSVGTGSWNILSGSGTLSSTTSPAATITNLPTGTTVLEWVISNPSCPYSSSHIAITVSDPVLSEQTNINEFCNQGNGEASVSISGASGTVNYTWMPGNLNGALQTNLSAGQYTVTGLDVNGCSDDIVITIGNTPAQQVNAGNDVTLCSGSSTVLVATGSENYVWSPAVTNNMAFVPAFTQTYTITATDVNGCASTDQVIISVIPSPTASFTASPNPIIVNSTIDFMNNSVGGINYYWNFGNETTANDTVLQDEQSFYDIPGNYYVTLIVTDQFCSDTLVQIIEILPYPDPIINVPNVFTPNHDGINDYFFIDASYVSEIDISIYNRWGESVIDLTNDHPYWNGDGFDDGVYFFKYHIVGLDGSVLENHGFVTISRN